MDKIRKSGLYYDDLGQMVLVTQGLGGYTLVAQKKILFRLFLDLPVTSVSGVLATIKYKVLGTSIKKDVMIPSGSLLFESGCPNGPSIGVLFTGDVFPYAGEYEVTFSVAGNPAFTPQFTVDGLVFLRPGRVRLLIHNLVGMAPWGTQIEPNLGWLIEMFQALERFSTMLPVRDGLKFGLAHQDAGLCFLYGENIDPWNCPSGPCTTPENIANLLRETNEINAMGTAEHVDATIGWRPRDASKFPPPGGEPAGGQAHPGQMLASFVGGNENGVEKTASVLAQEVGHLFGLEPANSPHSDGGGHSKNRAVVDPFAFDFLLLKPYQVQAGDFIGDVMGVGWHQGKDKVLFNAFDWEHLRQQLVRLPGVSAAAVETERLTKKEQATLVEELNRRFAAEPVLALAKPGSALSKKGDEMWHWTSEGFQRLREGSARKSRTNRAASVEGLRAWLEALGVSEVYAPIDDRRLQLVINPNGNGSLPEDNLDGFGQMEAAASLFSTRVVDGVRGGRLEIGE